MVSLKTGRLALGHALCRLCDHEHAAIVGLDRVLMNINHLPDIVLIEIFSFFKTSTRIRSLGCVCQRWKRLLVSAQVWTCVDFSYQREVSSKVLDTFVFPTTRKLFLDECHLLKWEDISLTLS